MVKVPLHVKVSYPVKRYQVTVSIFKVFQEYLYKHYPGKQDASM